MKHDVVIVGAGPAGCSVAIQLAREGYSVVLMEKQAYPVHKLCGEFLSPEAQSSLENLGVLDGIRSLGPAEVLRTRVTTGSGAEFEEMLPAPALGLSRYRMDDLLFREARRAGARCFDSTTVEKIEGNLHNGFRIETAGSTFAGRVAVGAFGKRSLVERHFFEDFLSQPTGIVASKMHFAGGSLPGAIELHAFPGGYCGVVQIEEGKLNACWIGTDDALKSAGGRPEDMLGNIFRANPMLKHRLSALTPDEGSLQSVAQVSFVFKGAFRNDICMVGDAVAMIAPLCGDGMAMGMRSAEIAAPLIADFLRGDRDASSLKAQYDRQWRSEFLARIRVGRISHAAYVHPLIAGTAVRFLAASSPARRWLIRKTRGEVHKP